ncbi:MAG TPA: PepSY domain-containing protein [Bacillales bacterium]
MKKMLNVMGTILSVLGMLAPSVNAQGTISSNQARTIALERVHGEILNIGLEHEEDTRVYDVDMRTRYGTVEVIINASNGRIMEIKKEIEGAAD